MGFFDRFFKKKDYVRDLLAESEALNQKLSQDEILSLMESMSFQMTIEDIFSITGRGVVVTGKIEKGKISVGDIVKIVVPDGIINSKVSCIEAFRRLLNEANAGERVGLLLVGDIKADQLKTGIAVLAH